MNEEVWRMPDHEAGLCTLEQVGLPRQFPVATTPAGDMTASEKLKRDAMLAYKALGGPEYLRRNPELLDKALLKMIAEPDKKVDSTIKLVIDAPWMNPDRLSYFDKDRKGEVIDMAPAIAPADLPNSHDEIAKARAEHQAAQIKARDKQKMIDARRAGSTSAQRERPPEPLIRADDLLPPTPGDPRK